jgi:hypothetical protein
VGDTTAAGEAVESWDEIRDERNGLQYAVASWLTLAFRAYLAALETGAEVEPMEIAKWLTRALAWTAGELATAEDEPQRLPSASHTIAALALGESARSVAQNPGSEGGQEPAGFGRPQHRSVAVPENGASGLHRSRST